MEDKELIQEATQIDEVIDAVQNVDNSTLANYIADRAPYSFYRDVLIKPLAPVMVSREFDVPVVTKEVVEDGENIKEYDEVTKEIREIPSNFARGIVLKKPTADNGGTEWPFNIGDTVIYNKRFSIEFDIFKDSVIVKPYDILAKEN